MSFYNDLFGSEREKQGKELYDRSMKDYDMAGSIVDGTYSSNYGVREIGDVRNKFGLNKFDMPGYKKQVKGVFDPARSRLGTKLAQARKAVASRNNGMIGQPELNFSPVENGFADAFGNLEESQAQTELGGFDKEQENNRSVAAFFKSIQDGNDQFALNKLGLKHNLLNSKQGSISNYLDSLSDDSMFDDFLGVANTAAGIYGAFTPKAPAAAKTKKP